MFVFIFINNYYIYRKPYAALKYLNSSIKLVKTKPLVLVLLVLTTTKNYFENESQ